MPEDLAPGVCIEEIERGPKPIEGVETSTAALLGETLRGPQIPWLVTSYNEYLRLFGGIFDPGKYMPYAVKAFFDNGGRRCYVARVVGEGSLKAAATLGEFTVTAVGPGTAYNQVWVRIGPSTSRNKAGDPVGFRLRVDYWADPTLVPAAAGEIGTTAARASLSEDFDDLSVEPDNGSYFKKLVKFFNSSLVEIDGPVGAALPADASSLLSNGADGSPVTPDCYEVNDADPSQRAGLAALDLDAFRSVAVVYAPGVDYVTARKVIAHCEKNPFRFAVVDANRGEANAAMIDPRTQVGDTRYGAFYYPWIWIGDPRSGDRKLIPPGGAICGIYALSDNIRGVFKAPANVTVAGAMDLKYDINHVTQEQLNPRGVNVIRRFPDRGIQVWGARTLSSDPLWKYVSVQRLLIFLEASIHSSTQWVVFEPNDQRLWAQIKRTITSFLRTQWREGALIGAKEEEAFFVVVGRDTMTEDDILNGRLIVQIGVALIRPAEFVIFRILQKTQQAKP